MSACLTRVEGREDVAQGTMAFRLMKPAGFSFKLGQAIDVNLIDPPGPDAASAHHTLSLVSAPFEDQLMVATRMRASAFKQARKALPVGSPAKLEGPFGSLTLHNDRARPTVFIADGIGITPFMSMLRQATKDQLQHRLVLLYSNCRPEDSAFLTELQRLERENKHFRLVATMTQMRESKLPWQGETGLLGEALRKTISADIVAPIYYLAGPPAMVGALRDTLNHAGVDCDDIRSEEFYGY